jgi:hypothetical protein
MNIASLQLRMNRSDARTFTTWLSASRAKGKLETAKIAE